jgi:hypothetical protein
LGRPIVGSWQLAVGSWQLTVGSWQLTVGSWQLAVGRLLKITASLNFMPVICQLTIAILHIQYKKQSCVKYDKIVEGVI